MKNFNSPDHANLLVLLESTDRSSSSYCVSSICDNTTCSVKSCEDNPDGFNEYLDGLAMDRNEQAPQYLVSSDGECDGSHHKERRMKQQHRTPPAAPEFQLKAMHVSPHISNSTGPSLPLGSPKESAEENNATELSFSGVCNEPSSDLEQHLLRHKVWNSFPIR
ncbi:hypothetical protein Btru_044584 [Bulinus truncatus]|nr:hypothetical protein Btru_044584 [Bulinus truncatus]